MTPQSCVDDLIISSFGNYQRVLSFGHIPEEPTLFDEINLFLLGPPTTEAATHPVTEDQPPVTVSNRFPIASAPVTVDLTDATASLTLPPAAAAPFPLVPTVTATVDTGESQVQERL